MTDDLEHELELLGPPAPGSVLVFRGVTGDLWPEFQETIIDYYIRVAKAAGHEGDATPHVPLLVFLDPDASIEELDEDQMREFGWVRADV